MGMSGQISMGTALQPLADRLRERAASDQSGASQVPATANRTARIVVESAERDASHAADHATTSASSWTRRCSSGRRSTCLGWSRRRSCSARSNSWSTAEQWSGYSARPQRYAANHEALASTLTAPGMDPAQRAREIAIVRETNENSSRICSCLRIRKKDNQMRSQGKQMIQQGAM